MYLQGTCEGRRTRDMYGDVCFQLKVKSKQQGGFQTPSTYDTEIRCVAESYKIPSLLAYMYVNSILISMTHYKRSTYNNNKFQEFTKNHNI